MENWFTVRNEDAIASPALLVYPDRIRENLCRMVALAGDPSRLRPHVKTHKMEAIVKLKLSIGISKFKVSTIAEAELVAEAGGKDVLLAYPLVGPNIDRMLLLTARYPDVHFSALVDDHATLEKIAEKACKADQAIPLYVDLNVGMGRTGIDPGGKAIELYRRLCALDGVQAAGLHAYDGHLHEEHIDHLRSAVDKAFAPVWEMRQQLESMGLVVPNLIAAGTPTSKLLAQHPGVEVGAGTTVLWDAGQPRLSPDLDFLNAAVLLIRVVSRPSTNRLCVDLGHKAVSAETPHPRVKIFGLENALPVIHSEEHLVFETENANRFNVGDVLYGIPNHICPTVALYEEVWCVQDGTAVDTWPVGARRRKITI